MKLYSKYISICLSVCMLLFTTACQTEKYTLLSPTEGTASLTLQLNMPSTTITKGINEESLHIFCELKDGVLVPFDSYVTPSNTKAADGNVEDGGGMADLTVFLVDNNDVIVARKHFPTLTNPVTQIINFPNLEVGNYTVYAYANTEGNDWFSMPTDSETSFTPYKDALLKPLSGNLPTIQNGRMPLTAKQEITIDNANNSRTISMIRPVGKLSVNVINQRTAQAATISGFSLGKVLPNSGYVFQKESILPESATTNPYFNLLNDFSCTVFPSSSQLIFDGLLYETIADGGFKFSITYQEESDYAFQENLSGNLQHIDRGHEFLVKLQNADLFMRLEQVNNTYKLELVSSLELDDKCYWYLSSNGRQRRGLTNSFYEISLNLSDGVQLSNRVEAFKYSGGSDYTTIGEGNNQLTYNYISEEFITSSSGSHFQFYEHVEIIDGGMITTVPVQVLVQDPITNTEIPLTEIARNQHIVLNIVFK